MPADASDPTPAAPSTRVALALGAGGARGYAHIGVIQVLEERGYEIASVAGCSMGALVGGLHAAGRLGDYADWVTGLSQMDVLRLLDVSLTAPAAIRADRIFGQVSEFVDGRMIEDLPIPFTAVATDLVARREVWFQRGPLDVAIRASTALPGVFSPVMLNGRLLVDGGLMDPVPIAPTAAATVDVTIAISLAGERGGDDATTAQTAEPRPVEEWAERLRRSASQALDTDLARSLLSRFLPGDPGTSAVEPGARAARSAEPPTERLPPGLSRFEVMNQALEAMQSVVTRHRLAGFPPDVLITVPRDACRTLDFHRAGPMIELGRAVTARALDDAGLPSAPAGA